MFDTEKVASLQSWLDNQELDIGGSSRQSHDDYDNALSEPVSITTDTFEMSDNGNTDIFSQSSHSLSKRFILTPSSPSKKGSRRQSPSPTRKNLALLVTAYPSIRLCQPGSAVGQTPQSVTELRRSISHNNGTHVIPEALKELLREIDDEFHDIPSHMFDPAITTSTPELENLLQQVRDIFLQAERCNNHHKDENAWVEVVRSMFWISNMGRPGDLIEVISVQTQTINPEFLSTIADNILPLAKKADLALAFNPYHPKVRPIWDAVRRNNPRTCLSHMSDAYTSLLVMPCGMEIKAKGGDMNEAQLQLAVWTAALLEKLRSLVKADEEITEILPLLGITVIGHDWGIHISWKILISGETLVVGPYPFLTGSTASIASIFSLRDLLCKFEKYLDICYWPWYKSTVLEPLCPIEAEVSQGVS